MFKRFFQSESSGGFILIGCTVVSLVVANLGFGAGYIDFWETHIDLSFAGIHLDHSISHWINDGLMAIFFLLVGLEIERELYIGELSSFRNAMLPILAALGGMLIPALIHFGFNAGSPTQGGYGIPMATDIAFALGILSLAGKRVPLALKIFLTALAIIDDLGAITVIALFYTDDISFYYLLGSLVVFLLLFIAGKRGMHNLAVYIIGGVVMWYLMLSSGVHASIAGVLLAFAIPFHKDPAKNISFKLQHFLHLPVAFIILPLFALANTAIIFPADLAASFTSANSLGIMLGLVVGKLLGIFFASWIAVKTGIANLPAGISWRHIMGVAILGGIGFTMSIFIANLAFDDPDIVVESKMSILMGSVVAALGGLAVLRKGLRSEG